MPPTSKRIYKDQICLKVFWFTLDGQFEIRSLPQPPSLGLEQARGFGWAQFWLGDLGLQLDDVVWSEAMGLGGPMTRLRQTMCVHKTWWTHKVSMLQLQAPWGCSNHNGDKDKGGGNLVNKVRTKKEPTGTVNQSLGMRDRTTKLKRKCKLLCQTLKLKQGTAAPKTTITDSEGLTSLWLSIWQETKRNDNRNNESALTRWFKTKESVGLHKNNNDNWKTDDRKDTRWASRRELVDESSTRLCSP